MKPIASTLIAGLALVGAFLAPVAGAAPEKGPMPQGRAERMQQRDPAAMADKRLTALKTELKITAQQEAAWGAYVDTVKQGAGQGMAHRQAGMAAAITAPERHEAHVRHMKERLAHMEKIGDVLRKLYDQLTPEQKAVFDKHASHMGKGPGGHMGHKGRR